jgi:hypothetical protein
VQDGFPYFNNWSVTHDLDRSSRIFIVRRSRADTGASPRYGQKCCRQAHALFLSLAVSYSPSAFPAESKPSRVSHPDSTTLFQLGPGQLLGQAHP